MDRADDLRADYDLLAGAIAAAIAVGEFSAAAALMHQRRMIGQDLELLEPPKEPAFVDELAARRTGARRPPARRTKSG